MHYTTFLKDTKIQTHFEKHLKENICLQTPNDIRKAEALLFFVFFPQRARQLEAASSHSPDSSGESQLRTSNPVGQA